VRGADLAPVYSKRCAGRREADTSALSDTSLAHSIDPDTLALDAGDPAVVDVMRDEVVFCLPSTPIDAVAKLMADNELSEIVVLVDRRPIGFVSQEDIVGRLVAGDVMIAGSDFAMRPVMTDVMARDIIRTPPLLIDERQRLSEAVSIMASQTRALAVVMHEDETPVGMLTPTEVATHASRLLRDD
jgi:CBS domain-containing protein